MLFKLQTETRLSKRTDQQAVVFDGLEHPDKKRILDKSSRGKSRLAAAHGEVSSTTTCETTCATGCGCHRKDEACSCRATVCAGDS